MMVQGTRISSDQPNEKKVRIVDFGDTLAEILRNARKEQLKNRMQYGELYHKNYYREVKDKNRVYYEFYHLDGTENVPEDYKEISFVCLRPDGSLELPSTLGIVCQEGCLCRCVATGENEILQIHPVSEQSSCKQFLTCLAVPNFHPVLSRQRIFPYNLLEHSLFRPDDRTHSKLCFCLLLLCSSFCGKVLRTAFGF